MAKMYTFTYLNQTKFKGEKCTGYHAFAVGCSQYYGCGTPKKSELNLRLEITGGQSDSKKIEDGQGAVNAYIPLGASFSVSLTKESDGSMVAAKYLLSEASLKPSLAANTLFKNANILEFGTSEEVSDTKSFQTVHLGSEKLTILPADSSQSSVIVIVNVNRPSSLGTTHNQLDKAFIDIGNSRGVPPQYLKGQVKRESNFDRMAYRYEPITSDLKYISRGQNLRTESPYSLYRIATETVTTIVAKGKKKPTVITKPELSQGTDIIQADISPRNKYYIVENKTKQNKTENSRH